MGSVNDGGEIVGRTRTRAKVAGVLAAAVTTLAALGAPAAEARDATVRSFDQTPISMHFFPAEGLAAGARAPSVLIGPGFGQSGETNQNSSSLDPLGNVGIGPLRRAGYNVLTWDPRGFGRSGGSVHVDSPDYEARDASALIDWLSGQPEAQLDKAGDPRVGMSGGSYGGGIQWITAARDARVDVIAPNISWNSLITSLNKDESLKFGWGSALCGLGLVSSVPGGLLNQDGIQLSRLDPHMFNTCVNGIASGKMSPEDRAWFAAHGPNTLLSKVRIPTLITQGTVDTLFTLKESISNYASLRSRGNPLEDDVVLRRPRRLPHRRGRGRAHRARGAQLVRPLPEAQHERADGPALRVAGRRRRVALGRGLPAPAQGIAVGRDRPEDAPDRARQPVGDARRRHRGRERGERARCRPRAPRRT